MNSNPMAEHDWNGRTPVSRRFNDPYFSTENGLAETRHVFLDGNNLPARFRPGFHIAELGFGTGLNALAAWKCWLDSGQTGQLKFTSFEGYPMNTEDLRRSLEPFPEISELANVLTETWNAGPRLETDTFHLKVVIGNVRETIPNWCEKADAWFLDGFAPALNPEMWSEELMAHVRQCAAPYGTFATYTAAGHVRRALTAAGFEVERRPGFGRKRHMTVGRLV